MNEFFLIDHSFIRNNSFIRLNILSLGSKHNRYMCYMCVCVLIHAYNVVRIACGNEKNIKEVKWVNHNVMYRSLEFHCLVGIYQSIHTKWCASLEIKWCASLEKRNIYWWPVANNCRTNTQTSYGHLNKPKPLRIPNRRHISLLSGGIRYSSEAPHWKPFIYLFTCYNWKRDSEDHTNYYFPVKLAYC